MKFSNLPKEWGAGEEVGMATRFKIESHFSLHCVGPCRVTVESPDVLKLGIDADTVKGVAKELSYL